MARFLALDWDHQHLHAVLGTAKHGRLHINRAFSREEKQVLSAATAKDLGQNLRAHLKAEKVAPRQIEVKG